MSYPTDPFTRFVSTAPLADTPGSSDMFALIQGGITKRLPVGGFPGLTPIITVPTTVVNVATYNMLLTDYTIAVERSPAGATTINLPGSAGTGRPVIIKDVSGNCSQANPITITNGTIDGATSYVIEVPYGAVELQSVGGSNWAVMASYLTEYANTLVTAGATYNATLADRFIGVNKSVASPTTINLVSAPPPGTQVTIKDVAGNIDGTNSITIANATIDGNAGYVLPFPFEAIVLRAITGNTWAIISKLIG